jgi:hypothetical protein
VSATDIQAAVARLYTEPDSLAEFLANPRAFADTHAPGSADLLVGIDTDRLQHFARSLQLKRAREAERLLPLTATALGNGFRHVFLAYSAAALPCGIHKPLADALGFCYYLEQQANAARHALETARFERLSLNVRFRLHRERGAPTLLTALPRRMPWIRFCRADSALVASADDANTLASGRRRRALVVFVSVFAWKGIWRW